MKLSGVGRGVLEGDAHDLLRRSNRFRLHGRAAEVLLLVILGSPLAGLVVDDELPAAVRRKRVEGVVACGHGEIAEFKWDRCDECGGWIGSGAPDLIKGDDVAYDFASTYAGPAVPDVDGATRNGDGCGGGRTGHGLGIRGSSRRAWGLGHDGHSGREQKSDRTESCCESWSERGHELPSGTVAAREVLPRLPCESRFWS